MISVLVSKKGNYPVSAVKIKRELTKFFTVQGVVSDADVNVAVIGESEMLRLGRKYLNPREKLHNVLSFVPGEAKHPFIETPKNILHLGDIAVCYPIAVEEAKRDGVLVEEKVIELLIHGAYHLLGKHHE